MTMQSPVQPGAGRPGALSADGDWWSVAACRYADPDLFFPVSASGKSLQQVTEAKEVCARCQVRAECLAFALRTNQLHGVWGGMAEEERYRAANAGAVGAGDKSCSMPARSITAQAGHPKPTESSAPGPGIAGAAASAAGAACSQLTPPALAVLRESVERASRLPSRPGWERKAAAHAEIFRLLAAVAPDPAAGALSGAASLTRDLLITVGPAANGMTVSSRQRLLGHLQAGHGDSAVLEMESHLRALHFMGRLARRLGAVPGSRP